MHLKVPKNRHISRILTLFIDLKNIRNKILRRETFQLQHIVPAGPMYGAGSLAIVAVQVNLSSSLHQISDSDIQGQTRFRIQTSIMYLVLLSILLLFIHSFSLSSFLSFSLIPYPPYISFHNFNFTYFLSFYPLNHYFLS